MPKRRAIDTKWNRTRRFAGRFRTRSCLIGNTPSCLPARPPDPGRSAMTAIDFAAFVDRAGCRLRRDHPAVLSHRAWRREQEPGRRLRSGHRRRPRRRGGDAHLDHADVPGARHHRRGIRRRTCRRGICLGARSDRRHQILHLRHAGLGHADRADPPRRADLRHDAPAVHRASISPATAARRAIAAPPATAPCARGPARACRMPCC